MHFQGGEGGVPEGRLTRASLVNVR
jgi:hypothetical protein